MLPEYFAVIGAIIASIGGLYYLFETITGKSKPNRITWLLWGLFPMITFVAQQAQGVKGLSWASFVSGLTPILVVVASLFNKKAYWKTDKRDYICMVIGFLGIILWAIMDNPNLAILFTVFADAAAGIPTIIKAKNHPETESWIAFAISSFGFGISLLSIQTWDFQNAAFITYLFVNNTIIALLAYQKPSKKPLDIDLI